MPKFLKIIILYVCNDIIYTSSHIYYNRRAIEHYSIAQEEFQFLLNIRISQVPSPKHAVILFQMPF